MRKVFNKVMAGAMTTALVATLAVGFKTFRKVIASAQ